jgi:hypothetical protein
MDEDENEYVGWENVESFLETILPASLYLTYQHLVSDSTLLALSFA